MANRRPPYFVNCFAVVWLVLGAAGLVSAAIGWWVSSDASGWSIFDPEVLGASCVYAMVYSAIAEYGRFRPWLVVTQTVLLGAVQLAAAILAWLARPGWLAVEAAAQAPSAAADPHTGWAIYGASLAAAATVAAIARAAWLRELLR